MSNLKRLQIRIDNNNSRKQVWFDNSEYEQFKKIVSDKYNMSISAFFREVIRRTLSEHNS